MLQLNGGKGKNSLLSVVFHFRLLTLGDGYE